MTNYDIDEMRRRDTMKTVEIGKEEEPWEAVHLEVVVYFHVQIYILYWTLHPLT